MVPRSSNFSRQNKHLVLQMTLQSIVFCLFLSCATVCNLYRFAVLHFHTNVQCGVFDIRCETTQAIAHIQSPSLTSLRLFTPGFVSTAISSQITTIIRSVRQWIHLFWITISTHIGIWYIRTLQIGHKVTKLNAPNFYFKGNANILSFKVSNRFLMKNNVKIF